MRDWSQAELEAYEYALAHGLSEIEARNAAADARAWEEHQAVKSAKVTKIGYGRTSSGCTCCEPDIFMCDLDNGEKAWVVYPSIGLELFYHEDEDAWFGFRPE